MTRAARLTTMVEIYVEPLPLRGEASDDMLFAEMYARTFTPLVRYCRRLTPAGVDAEDVAQEAFVHAWASWGKYSPERPFWPWLVTIARRICIDRWRRDERAEAGNTELAGMLTLDVDRPDEVSEAKEECRLAVRAFRRLRPDHQRIVGLRDIEGWSYEEIATFEGVTVEAVRGSLRRARGTLRRSYERIAGGVPVVIGLKGWRRLRDRLSMSASRAQTAAMLSPAVPARLGDIVVGIMALSLAAGGGQLASIGHTVEARRPAVAVGTSTAAVGDAAAPGSTVAGGASGAEPAPSEASGSLPNGWEGATTPPIHLPLPDHVSSPENAEFTDFTPSPHFAEDGIVLAVGYGRYGCVAECPVLFRSLDRGGSWERLAAVGFEGGELMLAPSFPRDARIFANGPKGLHVSEDGGRTFRLLVPVAGPMFMSPGFSDADRRIIVGVSPGWEYDDRAGATVPLTFTPPPTSVSPTFTIGFPVGYAGTGEFYLGGATATAAAPQASSVFRCNGRECTDAVVLPTSVGAPELLSVRQGAARLLVAWRADALFVSADDGRSFVRTAIPPGGRLNALVADDRGTLLAVVGNAAATTLHSSIDGGRTWRALSTTPLRKVVPLPNSSLLGAAPAEAGGGLMCSTDGGTSWLRRCSA